MEAPAVRPANISEQWSVFVRGLVALFVLVGLMVSAPARAQSADGFIGWVSPPGPGGAYATAYEACYAQWEKFQGDKLSSRFIGAFPRDDDWTKQDCEWTRYQYLCPAETGSGINGCGTIIPSYVRLECEDGYTPTVDGHCRLDPEVERPICICDENGKLNPVAGNPILLSSGAKVLSDVDYATADGELTIERHYRSYQVGRPIAGKVLPRNLARGLVGGWNFNFNYEIQLGAFSGTPAAPNAKVAVLLPDGSGYGFVLQSSGEWAPDTSLGAANAATDLKLEFVGTLPPDLAGMPLTETTWKVTDKDDSVWTLVTKGNVFGIHLRGWPTERVARGGYTQTFAYNADTSLDTITDSFGRTATFEWNYFFQTTLATPPSSARAFPEAIRSITLPDATKLRYTYDPPAATAAPSTSVLQRLVKVERLGAADAVLDSVTYLYEDSRFRTHVTGIIDNRNVRIATYAYDSKGRAVSTEGADGANAFEVAYSTSGTSRIREVTNALGKVQEFTFARFNSNVNDQRLTKIEGAASASTPDTEATISYGTGLYIEQTVDEEGAIVSTTRDARGRPVSIVEADGEPEERTTTITWNADFNVPDEVVRPGLTETYEYDAAGLLVEATYTDTTSHSVPYTTNGQTRVFTYDWDANGRLLSANGPLPYDGLGNDDITAYDYDLAGNLLTVTNPLGHVTTFDDYDPNGRPGTVTDPNGVVTAYSYDDLGRVETITVEHPTDPLQNATTSVAYDEVGQVVELTLPSTDTVSIDYDGAGRPVSISAASGERIDYAYDAMGNVTGESVRRANGSVAQKLARQFDDLSQVLAETLGSNGHPAKMGYDMVGNVVSSITPNGHATTSAFNALDQLVSTIAPDSGSTSLEYDGPGNLAEFSDPIGVTTEFVYNGFGEVIQEVSPDRGTSTYWYNEAGQMIESSDGRGQVVEYARDYLGRVTEMVPVGRPSSEIITYFWDAGGLSGSYDIGRLAKIEDGSGATKFAYDHRGNLLVKEQAIGTTSAAQLAYTYDAADRVTQITYPSGRLVKYDYDSKGRVSAVSTKASTLTGTWTLIADNYSYEPFGPVSGMELGNGLSVENERRDDGRLTSRRLFETVGGANLSYLLYGYDADGNIASISDEVDNSNSVFYGYDNMNRLSLAVVSEGDTSGETYSYTSGTNQLASVTTAAGVRSISYDDRGNTEAETRPGSVTASVEYDGYGRLNGYDRTDLGSSSFSYNGLDDRVSMSLPTAGTRHFIYDSDGRVMGEYGASISEVQAEFIWALPHLAAGSASFGGDDGLGGYMPLAVATPDVTSTIQINWVHGNHLGVPLIVTDAAGDLATTPDDYLAMGFPGQSRIFSDLYYNRYRDYDPTTGRYIQADPIGLVGGENIYVYAVNNPVNVTDPEGLHPLMRGAVIVGGVLSKIWRPVKKFFKDVNVDGPELERNGRICQIRYKKKPWFRLDYHPYPGTEGNRRLHGHFPWNPKGHVPLDPRRILD